MNTVFLAASHSHREQQIIKCCLLHNRIKIDSSSLINSLLNNSRFLDSIVYREASNMLNACFYQSSCFAIYEALKKAIKLLLMFRLVQVVFNYTTQKVSNKTWVVFFLTIDFDEPQNKRFFMAFQSRNAN